MQRQGALDSTSYNFVNESTIYCQFNAVNTNVL